MQFYIVPNNFETPIVLFGGFAIIIIGIFLFFIDLNRSENNKIIFSFKVLNENLIKIIMMSLMIISFFIPPITFSKSIIAWNQIGPLNYFRAIVFLIGCAFLPGACIFKLLFPNSTLHERFKVEPFLLKITIYPLLSFSVLGISTFIIDQIGLVGEIFTFYLFLIIIILFIFDLLVQKLRGNNDLKLKRTEIKISKYTSFLLLIALGIIIVSLGILLYSRYLIPGDIWRGISSAHLIGRPGAGPIDDDDCPHHAYYAYVSFGLSVLSGIPYININAMLFPFLYLFITSIYLLMKAILLDFKEFYSVLSTIFVVIFSGLFYIFNSILGNEIQMLFTVFGIYCWGHRSLAYFLSFISMALFIVVAKTSKGLETKSIVKTDEFKILFLVAFFLINSYLIYFIPLIAVMSLIIIYCLFSNKKKQDFKFFLIFLLFFIVIFIPLDIISAYYFSWIPMTKISVFTGDPEYLQAELYSTRGFLTALFVYSILIGCFVLFISIYISIYFIYKKFLRGDNKRFLKFKFKINPKVPKVLFALSLIIFSGFFAIEIFIIFLTDIKPDFPIYQNTSFPGKIEDNFFNFYLTLVFFYLGFIGILGIYLSYFCFKENKQLFYTLLSWGLFIFILASILIFRNWLNYSSVPPLEIPEEKLFYMMYWFTRVWNYSIIPLSIFASIGTIKLRKFLKSKSKKYLKFKYKNLRIISNLTSTSIIIFLTLSNIIMAGIYWTNRENYYVTDDDAQIIGWASENIPADSNILVDRYELKQRLTDIAYSNTYYIWDEEDKALENYDSFTTYFRYDPDCIVQYIDELDGHEDVLKFKDQNDNGNAYCKITFDSNREDGYVEFYVRTTDKSKSFKIHFYSPERTRGISIAIEKNGLYYRDGDDDEQLIMEMDNDVWYKLKIYFECTDGNYKGLNQYRWKVTVDGIEYGDYVFWEDISEIRYIDLFSNSTDSGWSTYFDDFDFSWTEDSETTVIIDRLKSRDFEYFILSKKNEDMYNDLISNFYEEKLYKSGNLAIFYANEN